MPPKDDGPDPKKASIVGANTTLPFVDPDPLVGYFFVAKRARGTQKVEVRIRKMT